MISAMRGGRVEFWVRVAIAAFFALAAGLKLAAVDFEVQAFAHFGYPLWFMYFIGAVELVGAALLVSRGVSYGAAVLAVVMVGALGTHIHVGDPVTKMLPAAVLLVLLGLILRARWGAGGAGMLAR